MSPNPKPGNSAETPEERDKRERELLAKAVKIILSWPEPSRDPEEAVPELPGRVDSSGLGLENRSNSADRSVESDLPLFSAQMRLFSALWRLDRILGPYALKFGL